MPPGKETPEAVELWQAAILGLVEGITEYLPISSTGHLIIASSLMGLDTPETKRSVDAFTIIIQGGAILAVLGLYRQRVAQMILGLLGKNPAGLRLALCILIAFLPAAVLGVLLSDLIETYLFRAGPVLAALFLGGVFMIAIDRRRMRRHRQDSHDDHASALDTLSYTSALTIGLIQCLAMWPGTSRSMMTITGGVLTGLKPRDAAEFSFLLGLPTLGGACAWKILSNLRQAQATNTPSVFETVGLTPMLVGVGVATVSAALAVKWLVGFLNRHGLEAFGWYRIALAIVLGALIAAGLVSVSPPAETAPAPAPAALTD